MSRVKYIYKSSADRTSKIPNTLSKNRHLKIQHPKQKLMICTLLKYSSRSHIQSLKLSEWQSESIGLPTISEQQRALISKRMEGRDQYSRLSFDLHSTCEHVPKLRVTVREQLPSYRSRGFKFRLSSLKVCGFTWQTISPT